MLNGSFEQPVEHDGRDQMALVTGSVGTQNEVGEICRGGHLTARKCGYACSHLCFATLYIGTKGSKIGVFFIYA